MFNNTTNLESLAARNTVCESAAAPVSGANSALTALAVSTTVDAQGQYKIVKRLQRLIDCPASTSAAPSREILDLEVAGSLGCVASVTLNGMPLANGQCFVGLDGVLTVLDTEQQVIDRLQLPGAGSPTPANTWISLAAIARIGVVLGTPSSDLASYLRIAPQDAVVVKAITAGSPASKAGLEVGDVLLAINGEPATIARVAQLAGGCLAGDQIRLVARRGNCQRSLEFAIYKGGNLSTNGCGCGTVAY